MGIIYSRAEMAQAGIPPKDDGVFLFCCLWNNSACVLSPLPTIIISSSSSISISIIWIFIYMQINDNAIWKSPLMPFRRQQPRPLESAGRWHRPQVPATHEYAALTFETLRQISRLHSLHWHRFTPNHKGFKQMTWVRSCCKYFLKEPQSRLLKRL